MISVEPFLFLQTKSDSFGIRSGSRGEWVVTIYCVGNRVERFFSISAISLIRRG